MSRDDALAYAAAHADRFRADLDELLAIPSVSARSEHAGDVRHAAEWVAARLAAAGMEARLVEGKGHPLVRADWAGAPGAPTVILYGHYDVQPVDPLDEWETPPFRPTVVDGFIRARGAADDKGPTLAWIEAIDCWLRGGAGALPVNVVALIEGEEEVGGRVLPDYVAANAAELGAKAEAVVILDIDGRAPGVPALAYGLRGICTMEVAVTGPSRDLHSGSFGGVVKNPCEALAELLASCRNADGSIAIPGVVEGVRDLDPAERERFAASAPDATEAPAVLAETGAPELWGEAGHSVAERRTARPTFEVNGIFGGYQGEGSKTIIPARAGAKLSLRIVPDQDPEKVVAALDAHLKAHAPKGVTVTTSRGFGSPPVIVDVEGGLARAAREALRLGFGVEPALTRVGGSIPVVSKFQSELGVTPLLLGTYRPGERAHSPNERYHPDDFAAAIRTCVHLFAEMAAAERELRGARR